EKGAFTGEVSAAMLKDINMTYVITGHSERREIFGETDSDVNKKNKAVLSVGMIPIVCVGETDEERTAGKHEEKVQQQVTSALEGLKEDDVKELVIAYEPIWAIGTGKRDRKSTRLNSSHVSISYAVFCLKKKKT